MPVRKAIPAAMWPDTGGRGPEFLAAREPGGNHGGGEIQVDEVGDAEYHQADAHHGYCGFSQAGPNGHARGTPWRGLSEKCVGCQSSGNEGGLFGGAAPGGE